MGGSYNGSTMVSKTISVGSIPTTGSIKILGEFMFTFEFDVNEVNAILAGLGKLPAEISYELIGKIKVTAESQIATMEDPKNESE